MKDYPFIKCLYPKLIVNKYTGDQLQVPCNDCVACYNNRSSHWTALCNMHEADFKFCMMVTLTYDDDHVPYVIPERHFDNEGSIWYTFRTDSSERFGCKYLDDDVFMDVKTNDTYVCCPSKPNFDDLQYIILKSNNDGKLNVLCKRDFQLFFKRLRKYLSNFLSPDEQEKISYFGIGEYGPVHFRPHGHFLLYFNEWSTLRELPRALYKAWKFGNIHYTLSRGECGSYCSSYLNSFTRLPSFFKYKAFRPFQVHSAHFALSYYENDKKALYALEPRAIIEHVRKIGDREKNISVWRTFNSVFFPKCRGFSKQSYTGLCRLYTCYSEVSKHYGETSISKLAWFVCTDTSGHFDYIFKRDNKYFQESLSKLDFVLPYQTLSDIERDLYISKHFINFCCNGNVLNFSSMLYKIQAFYKEYEYLRLVNWYRSMVDTSASHIPTGLFYDNYTCDSEDEVIPLINESSIYKQFRMASFNLAESKIKHKKLNDLNLKFLQNG